MKYYFYNTENKVTGKINIRIDRDLRYAEFHGRNTYSYISINGIEDDISYFKYRSVNHPSVLAPDSPTPVLYPPIQERDSASFPTKSLVSLLCIVASSPF